MTRSLQIDNLKAPFPYFGGKSRAASLVWQGLGDVKNYVEPFFGSGAVLLNRPHLPQIETVNDADGMLANFWRALAKDPLTVAEWADAPIHECDLHARHSWLVSQRERITSKLEGDPDWFDAKAAGWWVWGISLWIGSGWCSGNGSWVVQDGELVNLRQLPHLGNAGRGVNRKRQELLLEYFQQLANRLRYVRVCCGDWSRVTGPSVTVKHGLTGIFLDPPYADTATRAENLYAKDSLTVAHSVREWAIENGENAKLRIILAGYEGEHEMPSTWRCVAWKPSGGYDGQNKDRDNENRTRERLWFSPHCLPVISEQVSPIADFAAAKKCHDAKAINSPPRTLPLFDGLALASGE